VDDGIGLLGLRPIVEEASTTPEHDLLLSGEVVGNAPSWRQLDSGELIISPADVGSRDVQSVQWSSGPRHERADDNGSLSARADDRTGKRVDRHAVRTRAWVRAIGASVLIEDRCVAGLIRIRKEVRTLTAFIEHGPRIDEAQTVSSVSLR